MSKIDTLIQQLQFKKKKIDYLLYIKDVLTNDQKCVDFVEVQEEVLGQLVPLIEKLAENIENDVETKTGETPVSGIGPDELHALKMLTSKLKEKAAAPVEAPKQPVQNKQLISNQDKLSFAMDNRHLSNRQVRVINDRNMEVTGTVVGLDAPNVIVKTTQGPTIQVPLDKIEL